MTQNSSIRLDFGQRNRIGRGQLQVLDSRVEARRRNCEYYEEALSDLPGVAFMPEAGYGRCTRWLTCITLDPQQAGVDREQIRLALETRNIESRPVWKPMHLQPLFAEAPCYGGAVSERFFRHGLCLPSGSNLSEMELARVVAGIRETMVGR